MASGDESSELSSLSALSSIASDDELGQLSDVEPKKSKKGILNYFSKKSEQPPKEPSPPPRKRSPSPPHEYVLADNPDIAVRVARTFLPAFLFFSFQSVPVVDFPPRHVDVRVRVATNACDAKFRVGRHRPLLTETIVHRHV
jgi:hypothetical protein